ncbi:protein kinase [Telmatocola sphagniphila]|uniref:Protein kinase n=1 Tax=Telmatocola sphagniphila TaxID=1123043 RepID=A0A8E6ETZ4_9BACT|nr:serine/threonine-protein kinase [Telmatocola sphagniphila]QVL30592.1 protein kinase [Telmatocola sphagniphila]
MIPHDSNRDTVAQNFEALKKGSIPDIHLFPGYELLSEIGSGGMGVIYCARQVSLNRVVALKTIKQSREINEVTVTRFIREAQAIARLRHPNIITAYDCGENGGVVFYSMELLDGKSLETHIREQQKLEEQVTWQVIRQACAGLAHAASEGIVHRDIKPGNLYLTPTPEGFALPPGIPLVKVTDFGLAIFNENAYSSLDTRLTSTGVIIGTPLYMAPEQFEGHGGDLRTDIYSLGVTAFEMLVGQLPFADKRVRELISIKSNSDWSGSEKISPASLNLIRYMTALDPNQRPQSYVQLIAEIDKLLSHSEQTSNQSNGVTRLLEKVSWKRVIACMTALMVIAVLFTQLRSPRILPEPRGYNPGVATNLFDGQSLTGWSPLIGAWSPGRDSEGAHILIGNGKNKARLPSEGDYRLSVEVDLYRAESVELRFALSRSDNSLVLRLSRNEGAVFGKCSSEDRPLIALSKSLPFQQLEIENTPTYNEMRIEHLNGCWYAWFNGKYLGGCTESRTPLIGEFELTTSGGEAHFTGIELTEMMKPGNTP